jgi:hypothetical protein
MVFLTSLNIVDTGFLDVNTRTNQLSTSLRVNSGSALQLKGVNFDIESSSNLDTSTSPGYTITTIKSHEKRSWISSNATQVTISILLNSNNTSTSNVWDINDMSLLAQILKLPHTVGWKALYYPVDNSATDTGGNDSRKRNSQIVYQLGATDTSESQGDLNLTLWTGTTSASSKDLTDVNYIPVRFTSCKINQTPDNKVMVTLQGVVTG